MKRHCLAALLVGLLVAGPAAAQPRLAADGRVAAGRLVVGLSVAPSGLDPHAYAAASDSTVHANIYEALVRIDPAGAATPALATGWSVAEGFAWDIALRPGVMFHDGSPFTAEDVVASFARASGLKTSLRGLASKLQPITRVEVRGPHALRLHTAGPAPTLIADLAKVPILRRSATVATEAEAFNSLREAVGTGPFRVAEALAQMWSRIGVATQVETLPWNTLARRAGRGEFAALLFACCSSTLEPLATTRDLLATHDPDRSLGASNYGRYGNAALDRILQEGLTSFDPAVQARARREAARLVAEEVPLILLYHPVNLWAARAPLAYAGRLDGLSPVFGAVPAAGEARNVGP